MSKEQIANKEKIRKRNEERFGPTPIHTKIVTPIINDTPQTHLKSKITQVKKTTIEQNPHVINVNDFLKTAADKISYNKQTLDAYLEKFSKQELILDTTMDLDDESIKNIELIKFKINQHQCSITGVLQDVISEHEHLQKLDKQLAEVTNNIDKITTAIDVIEIDSNQKTIEISRDTKNLDPRLSSTKIQIREKTTISKFWTSCNKLSSILKDSIFGSNVETKKLTDSIELNSAQASQAKTEKDRLSITNAFADSLTVLLSPVLTLYVNAARTTEKTIEGKSVSSKTKELAKGILKTALIALSAPTLPLISLASKDARSRIQSNVEKYTSKLHYKHNNHETKL